MYSSQRGSSIAPANGPRTAGRRIANGASSSSGANSLAARLARKVFQQKYSLQLAPGVIDWLDSFVAHFELDDEGEITSTFEHLVRGAVGSGSGLDGPSKITTELLEETYEKLRVTGDDAEDHAEGGDDVDATHHLKIIDSFALPAWRWDETRGGFEKSKATPTLAPGPLSKAQYLRDRFNIIKQVILRNEHFCPPTIVDPERADYMKLTTIKNLLGRQGGHFLIFGLLTRMEDGELYLEDRDDKVKLDLTDATPESGLFTEGSFVLVDGDYTHDSIFKVAEIGHPPSERRDEAIKIHGHHDFLGVGALSAAEEADLIAAEQAPQHETSFIILSDLHLDNAKVLAALRDVLGVYNDMDEKSIPRLFVLCGNFRSRPWLFDGEAMREYTELFATLASLLTSFPALLASSHFLLIPGPTDPWSSSALPRPPLPEALAKALVARVPNLTLGSNPCRVRWFSQELVFFRDDIMGRMMRNAVRFPAEEAGRKGDLRKALVQTILDQAHLAPLPLNVRPVLWDFDHALRLYPMPTTLVLADSFDPYKLVYERCLVFNPGSFQRRRFTWSTYHPHMSEVKERMEESELPGPDD
ncbi:DNA polymerase alpha/epsilon subunit B-domain-containing protein [Rhodotorula diobovata]|uniref:DNA polymerase epsilon subunit B n=1 Tax=Rhodotorula diobovata TaxID=5288 RepID=A0A5C5FMD3_9BASI|nr:DNA polymerase alpha/epsilon subunit B-domain-containing protein [Rhodotorula diobovata]